MRRDTILSVFSLILAVVSLAAVSCGRVAPVGVPVPKPATRTGPGLTVTISAAASTKEIVETLATKFEDDVEIKVQVNTGGSSTLANQIVNGAPADLFLSASQQWADEVQSKDLAQKSAKLLTNKLVIVVPAGNPGEVKSPQDLLSDKVKKIALAAEKVPAGMYADQALGKLKLAEQLAKDSKIVRAPDVRATLTFVERGEVEAGIVYSTDVAAAKGVEQVYEFDPVLHDEIVYVLQLLKRGYDNPAAVKFFEYLQSADADAVYKERGFQRLTSEASADATPAVKP